MPGVTDEMAQIFQNQPLFIFGLRYFTYTSQLVLESPVRSGYLVPQGSNRDRDRLGFVPRPKITGPDHK